MINRLKCNYKKLNFNIYGNNILSELLELFCYPFHCFFVYRLTDFFCLFFFQMIYHVVIINL